MAGIDKAAIAFSVAVTIIGVGIAFIGATGDNSLAISTPPAVSTPAVSTETSESEAGTDPFADLAQKVRDEADEKETMMEEAPEEETMMEEAPEEETMMEEAPEEETMMEEAPEEETMMEEAPEEETMMEEAPEEETMMEEAPEEETMMEEAPEEETMMEEAPEEETMMEEAPEEEAVGPQTHIVDIPEGTAVPGCEVTDECYLPPNITINVGDTIEWVNVDTAAHTSSSGSPSEGPSFVFDSSLIRAGASFEFTFEEAGTFDYYCMVHPWMLGSVSVN